MATTKWYDPSSWLAPERAAEDRVDAEERNREVVALRERLIALKQEEELLALAEPFMDAKAAELKKVQEAVLFSKGEDTLRLQGRGQVLWEFVMMPEKVREERLRVQALLETTDAG